MLENDVENLSEQSNEQHLRFNNSKIKLMLFSSSVLGRTHYLDQTTECSVQHDDTTIERETTTKIQGLHFDEHLTWKEHITKATETMEKFHTISCEEKLG